MPSGADRRESQDNPVSREYLIRRAASIVVEQFKKFDVVILVPPGSGRAEVASMVAEFFRVSGSDLRLATYCDRQEVERLAEDIGRGVKVLAVPQDTASAVRLVRYLIVDKKLGKDKVCVLNLAGVYEEELRKQSAQIPRHIRLDYGSAGVELRRLGAKVRPGSVGVSLALWGRGDPMAVEKIRRLGPEESGVTGVLRDLASRLPHLTPAILAKVFLHLLGIPVSFEIAETAVETVQSLVARSMIRRRKNVMSLLVELVRAAGEARPYVEDELYEGVVDSVAAWWGLTVKDFRGLVASLADIARGNVEEEVERRLKKLEERLEQLERKLEEAEGNARAAQALHGVYTKVEDYPYIRLRDGRFYVPLGKERYELATTKDYEELASELEERLSWGGLVVLKGSAGSGKSTLAHYVAAKILLRSQGEVDDWRVYVAVNLKDDPRREKLWQLLTLASESGARVLLVYDPVPPEAYAAPGVPGVVGLEGVGPEVEFLLDAHSRFGGLVSVLIVLPASLYEHARSSLDGTYRGLLEANTVDLDERVRSWRKDFVRRILEVYSGCGDLEEVARAAERFGESHALVAKHAGLLLRERGCRAESARELLDEARGSAEKFVEQVVRERLGLRRGLAPSVVEERLRGYAVVLALRRPYADIPFGEYIVTPALMSYLMRWAGPPDDDVNRNHVWLSLRNEDLVEKVLGKLVEEAIERFQYLGDRLGGLKTALDVVDYILNEWGDRIERLVREGSAGNLDCWKKAIFIVGFAPFDLASPLVFRRAYKLFVEKMSLMRPEASRGCVDSIFLVDEDTPVLVDFLLLRSVYDVGKPIVKPENACYLVREVAEDLRKRSGVSSSLLAYLLGLAVSSLESDECLGESLRLLEQALTMATPLLRPEMVKFIANRTLQKLKFLGKAVPPIPTVLLGAIHGDHEEAFGMALTIHWGLRKALKPWEKAVLADVFLLLADKLPDRWESCFGCARELWGEIERDDEQLGLLVAVMTGVALARMLISQERYLEASLVLDELSRELEELRKLEKSIGIGRKEMKDALRKFLELRYPFDDPRRAFSDKLDAMEGSTRILKARMYCNMGVSLDRRDLVEKAAEEYARLAERSKGSCDHFTYGLASIATRTLIAEDIDDETLAKLEELSKKLLEGHCLIEMVRVSVAHAVLLAARGEALGRRMEVLEPLLGLLKNFRPENWASASLILSTLAGTRRPDPEELSSAVEEHMGSPTPERIVVASKVAADVGLPQETRHIVELAAPRNSAARLVLLLRALAEGNPVLAWAHAKLLALSDLGLFRELERALGESVRTGQLSKKARLLLAKTYLLHYAI